MGSYSEHSFVEVETPEGEELNSYPFILIVGSENQHKMMFVLQCEVFCFVCLFVF